MKLYIKQDVFSWTDRFSVMDESGRERYFVEGELFSWGKKLHVYDTMGTEVIFIQQKVISWLPTFHMFVGGQQVAEIVKELTFLRPRYRVNGLGWTVEGDFWAHEYVVLRGGAPVVAISKAWFTWGDSYVLDIGDARDELHALATVLTVDCVMAQGSS